MTVRQLYAMSCALIFETPDEDDDLKAAFPALLDQVLAEAVDYENQFRRLQGKELLEVEDIPIYESADDTSVLPFTEKLCRGALPLGIKAALLEEDGGKQAEAVVAYNKYVTALSELTPAVFIPVDDGEDEGA